MAFLVYLNFQEFTLNLNVLFLLITHIAEFHIPVQILQGAVPNWKGLALCEGFCGAGQTAVDLKCSQQ